MDQTELLQCSPVSHLVLMFSKGDDEAIVSLVQQVARDLQHGLQQVDFALADHLTLLGVLALAASKPGVQSIAVKSCAQLCADQLPGLRSLLGVMGGSPANVTIDD